MTIKFKDIENLMEDLLSDTEKLVNLSGLVLRRALALREREEIVREKYGMH